MYEKYIKRLIDILCALFAIVLLSPLFIIVFILVRTKLGKPAIFKQLRPGKNEKIFKMYKFRSMTNEKDENGNLLSDEQRLTKVGKLLRASSLDELPELFNILRGDMSFVGPRPLLVKDMIFMTEKQRKRHNVRQGLTGLAQINGRNDITWEKKFDYDLQYIHKITFLKDVNILLSTVVKVLKREGISGDGHETAEDLGDYLLRTHTIRTDEYVCKMKEASDLINAVKRGGQ